MGGGRRGRPAGGRRGWPVGGNNRPSVVVLGALDARLRNRRLRRLGDERLAALVARGDVGAFEALYDRHHAALLAFCRHMTGSREDGEDALQQTFLRAHRALLAGRVPDTVRPWLYAIARNRCRTLLAARRPAVPADEVEVAFDGLADDVSRRADLRELVADLGRLPEDQRGALVLHELGDLGHAEIATVIGCAPEKVKALVFQARTTLIADREARATPCEEIRGQLESARGGVLRRAPLRRHLRQCAPCSSYKLLVAHQRAGLAHHPAGRPLRRPQDRDPRRRGGHDRGRRSSGRRRGGRRRAAAITSGGGARHHRAARCGGERWRRDRAGAVAVKTLTVKVVIGAVVAGAGVTGAAVVEDHEPSPARAEAPAADRSPRRRPRPPDTRAGGRTSSGRRRPRRDERVATQGGGAAPGAGREQTCRRRPARAPSTARRAPRPDRPPAAPAHEPRGHSAPHARRPPGGAAPCGVPASSAARGPATTMSRPRATEVATPPATTRRRRPRTPRRSRLPPPRPSRRRLPSRRPRPSLSRRPPLRRHRRPPRRPEPAPPSPEPTADPDADAVTGARRRSRDRGPDRSLMSA